MNPDNRTEKRKLGDIGENIACGFLVKRGFEVVEKNYLRKWGEIDIVAKRGTLLHFVEVKSVRSGYLPENVSHGTPNQGRGGVAHETRIPEQSSVRGGHPDRGYRPEDNVHPWKLQRLSRAIQTYLLEKNIDSDWQLDLITVKINPKTRVARVELIENVNI